MGKCWVDNADVWVIRLMRGFQQETGGSQQGHGFRLQGEDKVGNSGLRLQNRDIRPEIRGSG